MGRLVLLTQYRRLFSAAKGSGPVGMTARWTGTDGIRLEMLSFSQKSQFTVSPASIENYRNLSGTESNSALMTFDSYLCQLHNLRLARKELRGQHP